jgi:hypothetical protein
MLFCEMPATKIIEKEFGTYDFPSTGEIGRYIRKYTMGYINITQLENAIACITMCELFRIEDLHSQNVGSLNEVPVILDYGFNDKTQQMYWGGKNSKLNVFISNNTVELKWSNKSESNVIQNKSWNTDDKIILQSDTKD